jgi:hypothetical protein
MSKGTTKAGKDAGKPVKGAAGMKQLIIRVSDEDRRTLKMVAAEQGTTVQEIVRAVLRGVAEGRHRFIDGQWRFNMNPDGAGAKR